MFFVANVHSRRREDYVYIFKIGRNAATTLIAAYITLLDVRGWQ